MNTLKMTILFLFTVIGTTIYAQEFIRVISENEIVKDTDKSQFIDNFIASANVINTKYIRIPDVINNQFEGKLRFSIGNRIIEDCILHAVDVSYQDENNYKWRGKTRDKSIDVTILKDQNGYSGHIFDAKSDKSFKILPVNSKESILIQIGEKPTTCGIEPIKEPRIISDCDEICPGHIDILFLVTPEAENWLVAKEMYLTYFNLLMAEQDWIWSNSGIPHTASYNIVSYSWKQTSENDCKLEAQTLATNPQVQALREQYAADVVVLLAPPQTNWGPLGSLACVAEVGPSIDEAFVMLPVDQALNEYIFVHEIGHILGANHLWAPHVDTDCAFAHKLNFSGYSRHTVMGNPGVGMLLRIPHFSDPDIYYNGVSTGYTHPTNDDHNNAGRIRETGCMVADFEESLSTNVTTSSSGGGCTVNIEAEVEPKDENYTYNWYWSYDGIFSPQYPGTYWSSGQVLSIAYDNQPVYDPCINYFFQMEVVLNGQVVATQVINQEGGICIDNVDCDDAIDGFFVQAPNFTEIDEQRAFSDKIESMLESTYYIFDVYGRLIAEMKETLSINQILVNDGYEGMFFIVHLSESGSLSTQKI